MEITFLGTACMQPTKERNLSGLFISYKNDGILLDCGEGLQRQLKIAGIKPTKITKILISHWHGDHVLGLPGLLQTMAANEYNTVLEIYGPEGSKKFMDAVFKTFMPHEMINYKVTEVDSGVFFEDEDFLLEAVQLDHGIPCLGFNLIEKDRRRIKVDAAKKLGIPEGPVLGKLQRGQSVVFKGKKIEPEDVSYIVKGKKVSFVCDTGLCNACYKLAKDADLLVSEAVFSSKHEDKATDYKHLTAKQAALMAGKAGAKKLVLTHFSQRYKDINEILEDAKDYFSDVVCAYDFMKIKL